MLTELSIKDFAIIDELTLTLNDGLTVLTGETGAGKSILIDAIQLLAGGRGSIEFVRYGCKKAVLEGLFTIDNKKHQVYDTAEKYGINLDTDGMIILHRSITKNGKSVCRINGTLVTLGTLKEVGKTLIDIHTQHETQSLMDVEKHIEFLELFEHDKISEAKREYQRIYKRLLTAKQRFDQFNNNEQEIAQRLDLLRFQFKELSEADLTPHEDENLIVERDKLVNFEKIYTSASEAYQALHGEQRGLDWLSLALSHLENSAEYSKELAEKKEMFSNHYYLIEELSYDLRDYIETLDFDSERLNIIETRLNEINRLAKKYGSTVEEMLEYSAKIEEEIEELENRDHSIQKLADEVDELYEDALIEAKHLHDLRIKASERFIDTIEKELKDLYLTHARFEVAVEKREMKKADSILNEKKMQLGPNGFDQVKFLLSTNPGEPVKDMHKIASGGELSRIMLALKKALAQYQGVTSIIFDEVDTGVSGRVAQAMAEKIHGISHQSQVLCITHLPQIAAMADAHLLISKDTSVNRTTTHVSDLSKDERIEELSRMITGNELTETSKEHANELIFLADQFKQS